MPITACGQEPVDLLDLFFAWAGNCPRVPAVDTADGVYSYEEMESLAFSVGGNHPKCHNKFLPSSTRGTAALTTSVCGNAGFSHRWWHILSCRHDNA